MTALTSIDPRVRGWATSALLGVAALLLLSRELSRPDVIVFDETYYVDDARAYLRLGGVEDGFAVHPPVGKWAIAAGLRLFGDDPAGWRAATVLAGAAGVVVLHRLALRLLADHRRREPLAVLAAGLLLLDGVWVVQARTAMLDAVLALLVLLGVHLVVVDRDVAGRASPGPDRPSRWRLAAGVVLGLAVATKWSGLLGVGTAGLLSLTWLAVRARAGEGWTGRGALLGAGRVAASLLLVPAAVYAATWAPWAANAAVAWNGPCPGETDPGVACELTPRERWALVADHHAQTWGFHTGLEAEHPYRSEPLTWPVLQRPVAYHYATGPGTPAATGSVDPPGDGEAAEVLLLGNPVVWWGFLLSLPLLLRGVILGDRRSLVPLLGWAGGYLPWLAVSRPAFLFYMVPVVPFMALGVAVAVAGLDDRRGRVTTLLGALAGTGAGLAVAAGAAAASGVDDPLLRWLPAGAGAALGAVAAAWSARRAAADGVGPTRPDAGPDPLGAEAGEPDPSDASRDAASDVAGEGAPGDPDPAGPAAEPHDRAVVLAGSVVSLAAVGLAVWFWPVWTGAPLAEELLRQRWWFESWV